MKVNLNEPYGENYENDLTLQEVYQFAAEKLKEHGMPVYDYLYEMPEKFSVVYSINPRTNNVLVPAFYEVLLYMKKEDCQFLTMQLIHMRMHHLHGMMQICVL